jgi:hypothetical protein
LYNKTAAQEEPSTSFSIENDTGHGCREETGQNEEKKRETTQKGAG